MILLVAVAYRCTSSLLPNLHPILRPQPLLRDVGELAYHETTIHRDVFVTMRHFEVQF